MRKNLLKCTPNACRQEMPMRSKRTRSIWSCWNVKTEVSLNETALRNKLQELSTLNGNLPVVFEESQYPAVPFPTDYQILKSEVLSTDRTLMALWQREPRCPQTNCCQQVAMVAETGTGYRRNTESGTSFNGLVVGFSFPLFEKTGTR